MARALELSGVLTATYTPFGADGRLDEGAYRALCERLVAAGSGLVPCGTTGETPTLDDAEYDRCVAIAVEVARAGGKRLPVVAGTGSNATAKTIATTRRARSLGADAALVVTPYYNKPPQAALLAHFRAVADEGGLPILIYNVPSRTSVNLAAATTLALAEDERFIGVKEAGGQLGQIEALCARAPRGFAVLSGDDAWTFPLVALGGHGVVSVAGNVAPTAVVGLVRAALAGDLPAARAQHFRLKPLVDALFSTTNPIPLKLAAAMLGHARADVRLPLVTDPDPDLVARLRTGLIQAGVL
ncbi:MAG: 4-hydroxy-tetrahydrodipicolinate synthase [Deltaproteobacteria bacterium]|nr:4-hydroxy-tetrahydrodipicolinate synthase [Deltaproteobacteria bacterium]